MNANEPLAPEENAPAQKPRLPVDLQTWILNAAPLLRQLEDAWADLSVDVEPHIEACAPVFPRKILHSYRWAARWRAKAVLTHRRRMLDLLLADFEWEMRPPELVLDAAAACEGPQRSLRVRDVSVRLDQAASARAWGIWYRVDSEQVQLELESHWSHGVVKNLQKRLAAMNRLPLEFRFRDLAPARSVGMAFERLVREILDENVKVSLRSRLDEDLCRKTDLRLAYPDLEGAVTRVQVTLVSDEREHAEKMRRVPLSCVVVSPYSLASAALAQTGTAAYPRELMTPFFRLFRPTNRPQALATELKRTFLAALHRPLTPLGPVLAVPAPVREFVRRYVEHEAWHIAAVERRRLLAREAPVVAPERLLRAA